MVFVNKIEINNSAEEEIKMELKKGQRLYQIVYWDMSGRKLEDLVIKKVNPKTVKLAWYDSYYLKKDKIGKEWFLSKEEAIANTIKLHKQIIKDNHEKNAFQERKIKMQIKSLESWLKTLKKK